MNDANPPLRGSVRLDSDNPWPGLDAFEEHARDYFHGRDDEAAELVRRVIDAPLTVLFGKSGLGKTSLLKAGLFPRLRERHYLPVYVRLTIHPDAPPAVDQVAAALRATIDAERVEAPPWRAGESLWEYLHRQNLELWSQRNFPLVPLVVLDQFEEVFTLGERLPKAVAQLRIDLGDLAENRIPSEVAARMTAEASVSNEINPGAMAYKIVVSLREDFLPDLEAWRRALPSLGRSRARLLPMRVDQAMSAVYETAPHLMDESMACRIVEFVAAAQLAQPSQGNEPADQGSGNRVRTEIEPALLSLFCRGLNEQRKRSHQERFDDALLDGAKQSIISDYYRACVDGLPESVSRFIENELITEKGFRNSYTRDDAVPAHLTADHLDRLINRRLLRIEERYGAERIELTHDLLTRAVMEHRTRRRAQDTEANRARLAEEERRRLQAESDRQRGRFRVAVAVAALGLVLAGLAGYQWWRAALERQRADQALRESESRDLAGQSLLVGATDPDKALDLALRAIDLQQAPQSERALRLAFARAKLRAELPPPSGTQFLHVAVSSQGDQVAVVRSDGVVDVRALPSLWLVRSRAKPASGTSVAFFGPAEHELSVVDGLGGVSRWNVDTGAESAVFEAPSRQSAGWLGWVRPVAGSNLLLRGGVGTTTLLDVGRRAATPARLCGREGEPMAAAMRNGGVALIFREGNSLLLCDGVGLKALKPSDPLAGDADWAWGSPDGELVATADASDEVVRVWDLSAAEEIATLQGFTAVPSHVGFADARTAVVGMYDGMIELWDFVRSAGGTRARDQIGQLTGAAELVLSTFGLAGGQSILSHHFNGPLRLWTGVARTPRMRVDIGDLKLRYAALNSSGDIVGVAGNGGVVSISPNGTRRELSGSTESAGQPVSLSPSTDRRHVLLAWTDGSVQVWNLAAGSIEAEFREPHRLKSAVWATPNCSTPNASPNLAPTNASACAIATRGENGTVQLHTIRSDGPVKLGTLKVSDGRGALIPHTNRWIEEVSSSAPTLTVYDLGPVGAGNSGTPLPAGIGSLPNEGWPFSLNGTSVLSVVYLQGKAALTNLDGPAAPKVLHGHVSNLTTALVSPDGTRILTASEDWTARLWDAASGSLLSTLRGHINGITQALFRRDGVLIATVSRDSSLRVWEPTSATQLFRFELGDAGGGQILDFEGASILYLGADKHVWAIECEPCLPIADLRRIGRDRLNVQVQ